MMEQIVCASVLAIGARSEFAVTLFYASQFPIGIHAHSTPLYSPTNVTETFKVYHAVFE